jgi:hypothetical protein
MATITINTAAINRAAKEALAETCLVMGRAFTESISDPKWAWPRKPSPRDIINTGDLKSSQELIPVSDREYQFKWGADYSLYVLLGYTTRAGNDMPARNWINDGLTRIDVQKTFALLLKSKL